MAQLKQGNERFAAGQPQRRDMLHDQIKTDDKVKVTVTRELVIHMSANAAPPAPSVVDVVRPHPACNRAC